MKKFTKRVLICWVVIIGVLVSGYIRDFALMLFPSEKWVDILMGAAVMTVIIIIIAGVTWKLRPSKQPKGDK